MVELTEEQGLIKDTAYKFSKECLMPFATDWDENSIFPEKVVKEMGRLGFLGTMIPAKWGGAGADTVSFALAVSGIAQGDGGLSTMMAVQALVENVLLESGSEEQKQYWLPKLTSGKSIGAFLLTEVTSGSDAKNISTKAERVGNHFILNGAKQFITSAPNSDIGIVFATTNVNSKKKEISAFAVPMETQGITIGQVEKKMGQRSSHTAQVSFENVKITPDCLLGIEGAGYKIALSHLESGRIAIAAQSMGFAEAAFNHAIDYAKDRKTFGKNISDHQVISHRLADMATQIEAGKQLMLHAARLKDAGKPSIKQASMAKLFCSETAEKVCSNAIQIFGGYGYLQGYHVERIYRDTKVTQIYEGTSDIQRMVIGREVIKND